MAADAETAVVPVAGKAANRAAWDGRGGWHEVWYATATDPETGTGLWFRYTLHVPPDPGEADAALWAFVFDPQDGPVFAAKRTYPIADVSIGGGSIVAFPDGRLAEGSLMGRLTDDHERTLAWDLSFEPASEAHGPMSPALARVAPSCYDNPNLDVRASGTVAVDGRELRLEAVPMGQSHIRGKGHAGAWAWMHLHVADGFVVEGLQARPHTPFGDRLPARPLMLAVLDGASCRFGLRGSSGRIAFPRWHMVGEKGDLRVAVTAECPPERLVQVTYHDPDGAEVFCANSEVADAVVEVSRRGVGGGWRVIEAHELARRAHMEFGAREPYPGVPVEF